MTAAQIEIQKWTAQQFKRLVLESNPKVAVFDCDGTLWGGDSGYGFMIWSLEQGLVSRSTSDWIDTRHRAYRSGQVSEEEICGEMVQLDLDYNTRNYPITVNMVIQNVATAKTLGATYGYTENADGSGTLVFTLTADAVAGAPAATDVKFTSQWLGSGAGRADAYVVGATANTPVGTDCWGTDTIADYVSRWNGLGDSGSADRCVF